MTSRYGTSPYSRYVAGSFGGYGGYGGMGGMGYGGYGGYNSFGGGFGGYPGYGGSFGGDPNGARFPQLAAGTAATFQLIESIVGAFSGFAQMLESTYMATHSSFFAMVGVAEQLAHLRQYLGDIFSVVALWRLIKRVFGWGPQQDPSINAQQFQQFQQQGQGAPTGAKPSKKPLVIFLLTVFGLPWLMTKLIRIISAQSSSQQAALPPQQEVLDPSKLTFVRAAYPFTSISPNELSLTTDDIVAVLEKGQGWSRGRKRDGSIGWFPAKCVSSWILCR